MRVGLGALGAMSTWAAYALILYRGLSLVFGYANNYGSWCATGRIYAESSLKGLIPIVLIVAGAGWGIAVTSKHFVKTARLGFIGSVLTSFFCLIFLRGALRAIVEFSR